MADTYDILGSLPVTVLLPTGKTQTQTEYVVQTKPSAIVFRIRLAPSIATASLVATECEEWSAALERARNSVGVTALSTYQDVDDNGTVIEELDVTVSSDDGRIVSELQIPQSVLAPGLPPGLVNTFADEVEAERERLNGIAAL